ncbi:MAG: hypothetical protein IKN04_12715 [Clostridia bacterium]|nr:hypothetical protein [Clostridia bacterium]
MAYLHGAYGDQQAIGTRVATESQSAVVLVGTAPVQNLLPDDNGDWNVNKPILVNDISEAKKYFGYSDDWAKYSLCEAMHVFLELAGVGPLVMINVLDPKSTHRSSTVTTKTATPSSGRITIANCEDAILDTIVVKTQDTPPVEKVKGTDYTAAYNAAKKSIIIQELTAGALGSAALDITYYTVTASTITSTDIIGADDGAGTHTGLYAIKDVYNLCGVIPAIFMAPGWSELPAVHATMATLSLKINGHWDAWMFTDIPISDNGTPVTMASAKTWKDANGYTKKNETVSFPMAVGTDSKKYHLSVIRCANFLQLLADNDGIPYHTASNTAAGIVANLWLGASSVGKVFDDQYINENLNKNGICSAAFVGGRWVIWGAHSAEYDQVNSDNINVSETNYMMLFYLSNDFQARRVYDVDQPLSANDIQSITAEEQSRLDALVKIGALSYGVATLDTSEAAKSDMYNGDFLFIFDVTTTPIAKSLTVLVNWVDDGFATYFEPLMGAD